MNAILPSVAVTVAPNGSYKTRSDHPALPITPAELARCASACLERGAGMFHLHVRDRDGRHLLDAEAYGEATTAIRRAVGDRMIIQATSEAAGRYAPFEQMAAIRATRPEAVSLALRELVQKEEDVAAATQFIEDLDRDSTMIQVILYSAADLAAWRALRQRGAFGSRPQTLLFVLGRYTENQTSTPADLLPFLAEPVEVPFSVCAFGRFERDCVLTAALLGGHARVGFENNLHMPDGQLAPSNEALVGALVEVLTSLGRRTSSAEEIRSQYL